MTGAAGPISPLRIQGVAPPEFVRRPMVLRRSAERNRDVTAGEGQVGGDGATAVKRAATSDHDGAAASHRTGDRQGADIENMAVGVSTQAEPPRVLPDAADKVPAPLLGIAPTSHSPDAFQLPSVPDARENVIMRNYPGN